MQALWSRFGPWARKALVIAMFLGIPGYVWWVSSGMIPGLGLDPAVAWGLSLAVVASLAFGAASAFLVMKDLDLEP